MAELAVDVGEVRVAAARVRRASDECDAALRRAVAGLKDEVWGVERGPVLFRSTYLSAVEAVSRQKDQLLHEIDGLVAGLLDAVARLEQEAADQAALFDRILAGGR